MNIVMLINRCGLHKGDVLTIKKEHNDHFLALHHEDDKLYIIKKNWVEVKA